MSLFAVSAFTTAQLKHVSHQEKLHRRRTVSLNIDSIHTAKQLHHILEEDIADPGYIINVYGSNPAGRPRSSTAYGDMMADRNDNKMSTGRVRRTSEGEHPVRPTRVAPPAPRSAGIELGQNSSTVSHAEMSTSPPRPGTFSIRQDRLHSRPGTSTDVAANYPDEDPDTLTLKHMDFLHKDATGDTKDSNQDFGHLIKKANDWLVDNPDVMIFNAETVTWFLPEKAGPFYTDSSVLLKCVASGKKTKFYTGLRVWYVSGGDRFWVNVGPKQKLHYRDYLPGRDNGISAAVTQINEDMRIKPIAGKMLRIETLHALQDSSADSCFTKQYLDTNRKYFTYLRMLYITIDGLQPIKAKVGLRDFVPIKDGRSPHSNGYESFSEVSKRCGKWLYQKTNIKVINLQSIRVKVKKELEQDMSLWENSSFTEHGDKSTDYLTILRVVYLKEIKPISQLTYKMSQKTFTPRRIGCEEGTNEGEKDMNERNFKDLLSLEARVNSWLQRSGARLLGIETYKSKCCRIMESCTSQEVTFTTNTRDKNSSNESWLLHYRLYLDGNYKNVSDS